MKIWLFVLIPFIAFAGIAQLNNEYTKKTRFKYYSPDLINLNGISYHIIISDNRGKKIKTDCSEESVSSRRQYLDHKTYKYFENYLKACIINSNGKIDSNSTDTIEINLELIGAKSRGFGFQLTFSYVEFKVIYKNREMNYCLELSEKDEKSPLRVYSIVWSKADGKRKMISGNLRQLFNELLSILAIEA